MWQRHLYVISKFLKKVNSHSNDHVQIVTIKCIKRGEKMFIVIEIDKEWTFGIDWNRTNKGIRLGFVAIHIVFCTLEKFVNAFVEAGEKFND